MYLLGKEDNVADWEKKTFSAEEENDEELRWKTLEVCWVKNTIELMR